MEAFTLSDVVGTIGVVAIVSTYFLLQINKVSSKGLAFSLVNAIGSMMIFYSLLENWNFSSALIEFFWILISFIGVYNYFKK